jgi:hypothetical protein
MSQSVRQSNLNERTARKPRLFRVVRLSRREAIDLNMTGLAAQQLYVPSPTVGRRTKAASIPAMAGGNAPVANFLAGKQ